ncbi:MULTISPECIES: hypothetical protein [unclassified Mycolicibacterium]|nr:MULTISPECIES: hypothetical protein [unclassified Mycolicibacterium]
MSRTVGFAEPIVGDYTQHPARGRLIGTATRLLCPVSITGGR